MCQSQWVFWGVFLFSSVSFIFYNHYLIISHNNWKFAAIYPHYTEKDTEALEWLGKFSKVFELSDEMELNHLFFMPKSRLFLNSFI